MKTVTVTRMPDALRRRSFWTRLFDHTGSPFRRTWIRIPFTPWGLCVQYRTRRADR